ncbi:DUF2268 domain-containing putative Zn-dependent protease [Eudoraea sp.]|uniref:DUF2268 domain-containing putative Zn-dependent protease n=1 Tax=Eudoraea sp. TaxID=1979955 RepID=UPI003C71772E
MNLLKSLILTIPLLLIISCNSNSNKSKIAKVDIVFPADTTKFTEPQKQLIGEVIINSEKEIRNLIPKLPDSIKVIVEIVDWNLDFVGGVTGRTETNSPPLVAIQISDKFPGGITNAVNTALKHVVFHEFHHLSRGWAIKDNKFEYGISIAMVNEGLAVVFSEEYTDLAFEAENPPQEDVANSWVNEIIALPKDADYQKWMFQHPDGRTSIGYRTGNFLVRQAMINSGKNIIELSSLMPNEIIKLAGY